MLSLQLPESEIEAIESLPHLRELKSSEEADLKVCTAAILAERQVAEGPRIAKPLVQLAHPSPSARLKLINWLTAVHLQVEIAVTL